MRAFLLFALVLVAARAEARVFNFQEAGLAAYFRGTGGMSSVKQRAFGDSSGLDTSIDGQSRWSYSGELGAQLALSRNLLMRLGVELMQHRPVSDAKGLNPGGAERFTLESSVFVFNPMVTFEYVYALRGNSRFYIGVGGGYADVTVENRYEMTALGETELGVPSFSEKLSATATSFHLNTGLETTFVDSTTFSIDLGYRHLPIKELKHKGDANTIESPGGVGKGDVARTHYGSERTLNLGGLYVGMTFKFYLHFL